MRTLVFVFILAFLAGCQQDNLEKNTVAEYPNGKPMRVEHFKYIGDRKVVLKETRYFPNGEIETSGGLQDGKRHGHWEYFKEDGFKWMEENYQNGELDGEFTVWYRSGDINYQGAYKSGKPEGDWTFFREDGSKSKVVRYENGNKVSSEDF